MIAGYQQDRWGLGVSRGVYSSVRFNGAWRQVAMPATSACVGGNPPPRHRPVGDDRTRRGRLRHHVGHATGN